MFENKKIKFKLSDILKKEPNRYNYLQYTCNGANCYFYNKDKKPIESIGGNTSQTFIMTDLDIEFFNFDSNSKEFYELTEYKLNQKYSFEDGKIELTILENGQKHIYNYKDKSLFESLEAPNILPNNNDSIFREDYLKNENENIYLSKYNSDYYPVLSVSPPNFIFEQGKYQYTSNGEASKLYEAFRNEKILNISEKIPKTLFLKPYCRQ